MSKYLLLRLEGPMQSWGLRASFDIRFSETMPTKSGVIGLLAAAKGIQRNDQKSLKELSSMKMMAICVKEGSVFTDFHTVGAGHKDRMKQLPKAVGGSKTAVTHRQYLSGYGFIVVLKGNDKTVQSCIEALHNPVYPVFLGRRSCPPSKPIYMGICNNLKEAQKIIEHHLHQSENKGAPKNLNNCRTICETNSGGVLEHDVPIDYDKRTFGSRTVSRDITTWFK